MDASTEIIHPRTTYYGTVHEVWPHHHRRGYLRGQPAGMTVYVEAVMEAGGHGVIAPEARLYPPSAFNSLELRRGDEISFLATRKDVTCHGKTSHYWLRVASVTVIVKAEPASVH